MNELSGGYLGLDSIQEADELLVTMALHTSANDLAFEHIESSKQRRCAVALECYDTLGDIRTRGVGYARVASCRAGGRHSQPA